MYRVNDVLELNDGRVVIVAEEVTATSYRVRKLDLSQATPADVANLYTTISESEVKRKVTTKRLFPGGTLVQEFDQVSKLGGEVCLGACVEWLLQGVQAPLARGVDKLNGDVCKALQAKLEEPCVEQAKKRYEGESKVSGTLALPNKADFALKVTRDGTTGRVKAIEGTSDWRTYQCLLLDERLKVIRTHLDGKLVEGPGSIGMSAGKSADFFKDTASAAFIFSSRGCQIISVVGTVGGHALATRPKGRSLLYVFDPSKGVYEVDQGSLSSWLLDHFQAHYAHFCGFSWAQVFTRKQ